MNSRLPTTLPHERVSNGQPSPLRIYLAGKISKNDLRQGIVPDVRVANWGDELIIFPGLTYVGPFFVGCDHGCGHGPSTHGNDLNECTEALSADFPSWDKIPKACLDAIDRADAVIAYINANDCFGTLVEIGYAISKNKPVGIVFANSLDSKVRKDMWFAERLSFRSVTGSHTEIKAILVDLLLLWS